jgi:hypothetical protein
LIDPVDDDDVGLLAFNVPQPTITFWDSVAATPVGGTACLSATCESLQRLQSSLPALIFADGRWGVFGHLEVLSIVHGFRNF